MRRLVVVALLAGCSGPSTTRLNIDVSRDTPGLLTSVAVTVFDPFGAIGQTTVSPAPLPGQLTVSGLPDRAVALRIAAVGTFQGQRLIGSTRATLVPHQLVTATVTVSASTKDGDGDGVPDAIDDCPTVADPQQRDASGMAPGDACSGDGFGYGGGGDLALQPALDMTGAPPADMMRFASTCGSAAVGLCDGFEGAALDPRWTTVMQAGGTATIDNTRAYRGGSSLHLHANSSGAGGSDVEIDEASFFNSKLYARAFVYVPSTFDRSQAPIMLVEQSQAPYQGITLDLVNDTFNTQNTLPAGPTLASTTPMLFDQWVCLEWQVTLGSAGSHNGTTALLVNGLAANGLATAQPLYATPAINQFGLGLIGAAGTPARDLWIDELIVDSNPIGCLK